MTEVENDTTSGTITRGNNSESHTIAFYTGMYRNIEDLPQSAQIIWLVTQVIYYTGIAGNVCVLFVVILDKKLHKATFVVLACLAISDALALIFQCVIMSLLFNGTIEVSSPEAKPLIMCLNIVLLISSLHVLYISILRYFIVVHPLKTYVYVTIKRAILGSVVIFTTLPLVALAIYFSFIKLADVNHLHFLLTAGLFYYTPILLMTGFHIAKCRRLYKRKLHADEDSLRKMSRTIIVIIVMSYVLPIPNIVAAVHVLMGVRIPVESVIICDLCFYAKHALNPFVYCFMSPVFRDSLKSIVMIVFGRLKFKGDNKCCKV